MSETADNRQESNLTTTTEPRPVIPGFLQSAPSKKEVALNFDKPFARLRATLFVWCRATLYSGYETLGYPPVTFVLFEKQTAIGECEMCCSSSKECW